MAGKFVTATKKTAPPKKAVKIPAKRKDAEYLGSLEIRKNIEAPNHYSVTRWYLLEDEPGPRIFFYQSEAFQIELPWIYYELCIEEAKTKKNAKKVRYTGRMPSIYFAKQRCTEPSDQLHRPPLPNFYGFRPCYSLHGEFIWDTLEEAAQGIISCFWSSRANTDGSYGGSPVYHELQRIGEKKKIKYPILLDGKNEQVLATWETLTQKQVLTLPWEDEISWKELPRMELYDSEWEYEFDDDY